ncbi:MAG: alpha/beta hydrolase [Acidobacteriota bacterium]
MALIFLLLIGTLAARPFAARIAERDFPPPGRLLDVGGRHAHIHCTGSGTPTILLESGLDTRGSWSWAGLRNELSQTSRVCAYDRAGILWSEPGEGQRDSEHIAGELHALLDAASEAPPYVMVGHSVGGLHVRVYDERYPGEVLGFVFVDPSHPEQDDRFPAEVREQMARANSFSLVGWIFNVMAPYRVMIEHDTPNTAYFWRSFPTVQREAAAIKASSEQASRAGSLGDRPVVVLTAGKPLSMSGISDQGVAAMQQTWLELHDELAALSSNSDHRVVEGAGHYIHVDRPEAVVAAVCDVVIAVREGGRVRRSRPLLDVRESPHSCR